MKLKWLIKAHKKALVFGVLFFVGLSAIIIYGMIIIAILSK